MRVPKTDTTAGSLPDRDREAKVPPGDVQGSRALLLLAAVPVAVAVFALWQAAMQTSAGFAQSERVTGWSAVLRGLPADALVLVPAAAGLWLATRSSALGWRRGRVAAWLHAAVLTGMLALVLEVGAESLWAVVPGTVVWPLLAVALSVGAASLAVSLAASRTLSGRSPDRVPPGELAGSDRAPGPGRTSLPRLAVVLVAAGIVGSFVWLGTAQAVLTHEAAGFERTAVPGTVTVTSDRPASWVVYAEGNAASLGSDIGIVATDPSGRPLAVRPGPAGAQYLLGGRGARAIGSFVATSPGTYEIAVTTTQPPVEAPFAPADPYGDVAVGASMARFMLPSEWGAAAWLVVTIAAAWSLTSDARRRATAPPSEMVAR